MTRVEFWERVDASAGANACWPWQGPRKATGYGMTRVLGGHGHASRAAFVLSGGRLRRGQVVMHTCDNRACCNPAHLRAGTQLQNIKDRDAKRRTFRKLCERKVACLRFLYRTRLFSQRELGRAFGITQGRVSVLLRAA